MRTKTINVFTLSELKDAHPEAYERVHGRWRESVYSYQATWSDETIDSLKAVVDMAGARLRDWSIGIESHRSYVKVDVDDNYENDNGKEIAKDAEWYWDNCITNKHKDCAEKYGQKFPGACALTGYCADDDFQEAVYKALENGDTLTEALEGLADVASRMMNDDMEQQANEESMEANWDDREYDENGEEV